MSSLEFPGAPGHVSHSAMEDYQRCPHAFELKRVEKVEQNSLWAGIGGTAVHHVTEAYDLGNLGEPSADEVTDLFTTEFDEAVAKQQERSPNYPVEEWYATGGGKFDAAWWLEFGPTAVMSYIAWRKQTGWDLAQVAGKPAVEVEMKAELPNGPVVLGFIDRVFVLPNGKLCVVDLKNSARHPDWKAQLGLYKALWSIVHPDLEPITYGAYWTSRSWGKAGEAGWHTKPEPLDEWTPELLTALYNNFIAGVNAGSFNPKPSNMCAACPVKKHCVLYGSDPKGSLANVSA